MMSDDRRPSTGAHPEGEKHPVGAGVLALLRDNKLVVAAAVAVVVFTVLLEDVLEGDLIRLDEAAYWLIVQHLRFDWLTPVMTSISALATPVALLVLLLVVAAFAPGRRPGFMCAVNLALVVALNQLLKFCIQRPRPEGFRLAAVTGFSFPSGHSMVAMAFFGLLAWFVWRYERDRLMKWLCCAGFALVIVLVGISRIYLGVHYASDVVAGFCVSLAWLAFFTRVAAPLFLGPPPARAVGGGPAEKDVVDGSATSEAGEGGR